MHVNVMGVYKLLVQVYEPYSKYVLHVHLADCRCNPFLQQLVFPLDQRHDLVTGDRLVRCSGAGAGCPRPDGHAIQIHRALSEEGETSQASLLYSQQVRSRPDMGYG